jgi:hypothetical protein
MDKRGYYLLKNWIPVSRNQTPNPDSKQTTQVFLKKIGFRNYNKKIVFKKNSFEPNRPKKPGI